MQALNRLTMILEAVASSSRASTAAEVSQAVGLSLSTTTRLMHLMADKGLLHRTGHDRRYTLGPRLFALVRAASADLDIAEIARPYLERLRDVTGETASLHVLHGSERLCVAVAESRHQVRRVVSVGLSEPVQGTATGSVLLAGQPLEERAELAERLRLGPKKLKELDEINERGWALVVDDWVPGLAGLSAAVRDGDVTVAALSVSGPSSRFTREVALGHLDVVLETALALGEQLRHRRSR
ncbi:MAG: IclR family transcriptional regulator [Actinomycetota bacterium]